MNIHDPVRNAAHYYTSASRLVGAIWYLALGVAVLALGIWIVHFWNWFAIGLGSFVALQGAAWLYAAAEHYQAARPPPRAEEVQHYLKERAMFNPYSREQDNRIRDDKRR
jgi:predicted tellurium resistance membrane protein TerC